MLQGTLCYTISMDMNSGAREWVSQARRGVLELCVLTIIGQQPRYGYELTASLGKWKQIATTEGTLYPMLRRLQKDGYITASWQESEAGPPRKYYSLTERGSQLLYEISAEWEQLSQAIAQLQGHAEE